MFNFECRWVSIIEVFTVIKFALCRVVFVMLAIVFRIHTSHFVFLLYDLLRLQSRLFTPSLWILVKIILDFRTDLKNESNFPELFSYTLLYPKTLGRTNLFLFKKIIRPKCDTVRKCFLPKRFEFCSWYMLSFSYLQLPTPFFINIEHSFYSYWSVLAVSMAAVQYLITLEQNISKFIFISL